MGRSSEQKSFLMVNSLFAQGRPFSYELKKQDLLLLPLGIGMSTIQR